ncbi:hypothetical protein KAX75_04375, partial [candidate division WOR-3 bacterium]|nr:hypothetical protein [candidate division WOR-3 bacterium]
IGSITKNNSNIADSTVIFYSFSPNPVNLYLDFYLAIYLFNILSNIYPSVLDLTFGEYNQNFKKVKRKEEKFANLYYFYPVI